jgi:hypothetical protein
MPATPRTGKTAASVDPDDAGEHSSSPVANVAPNAAVITIKGICDDKSQSPALVRSNKTARSSVPAAKRGCETVVTRSQFEKLADALQPNMPPQGKRQLANSYPRILTLAYEARKRGLDKDPGFEAKLQLARQQLLMQELNKTIQAEAGNIPENEIKDYYRNNANAYEQATLQRIFVPTSRAVEQAKNTAKPEGLKSQQDAAEAAMAQEADSLRARAASGADFDKLQKEAFDAASLKSAPPPTSLGNIRRTNLPPAHASVFDLKPNDISPVVSDPSGHYVYKMVSKQILPLDQVREEIHSALQSQRMKDALQNIQNSTTSELNEAYFGVSPAAPARGPARFNPQPGSKEPPKAPANPQ